jgi:hypothetical protein
MTLATMTQTRVGGLTYRRLHLQIDYQIPLELHHSTTNRTKKSKGTDFTLGGNDNDNETLKQLPVDLRLIAMKLTASLIKLGMLALVQGARVDASNGQPKCDLDDKGSPGRDR